MVIEEEGWRACMTTVAKTMIVPLTGLSTSTSTSPRFDNLGLDNLGMTFTFIYPSISKLPLLGFLNDVGMAFTISLIC